jgi:hypothetical protein
MTEQEMCERIITLKSEETEIKEARTALENALAAMVATKDEGTDKKEFGPFKVTVTSKLNRTLDYPAYLALENDIPEGVRCVDLEPKLNLTKLRSIDAVRPGFSTAFVTTRPGKPGIKIEVK